MANIDLIKKNIETMIAKGAPETDIDAYVASEGLTPEQLQAAPVPAVNADLSGFEQFKDMGSKGMLEPPPPNVLDDIGASLRTGLKQGAVGMAEGPAEAGTWLADKAVRGIEHLRGKPQEEIDARSAQAHDISNQSTINPANLSENIAQVAGPDYESFTRLGKFAREVGRFIPSTLVGGPAGAGEKLMGAITGGLGSEAAGEATAGSQYEWLARLLGGLGAGYAGGRTAGATNPPLVEGQTDDAVRILKDSLPSDLNKFKERGPEAMVFDSSPSTVGLGQGLAVQPGNNKNKLFEALTERNAGRPQRLMKSAEENLGEYQSPKLARDEIHDYASETAGPLYEAAKKNAPDLRKNLDLQNEIAKQLTQPIEGMSLSSRSASIKFMNDVDDAFAAPTPSLVVERLHDLRKRLDKYIDVNPAQTSAEKADAAVAQQFRRTIDNVLKEKVPGWKEADDVYASAMDKVGGINYGYKALEKGSEPISPEQFRGETTNVPTRSQKKAMGDDYKNKHSMQDVRTGMTANVRDTMGTNANDYLALKNKVGGDNAYNRDKLIHAYGEEPIKNISRDIENEAFMAGNANKAIAGSETAARQSAERMVNVPDAPAFTGNEGVAGLGLKAANSVYRKFANKFLIKSSQSTRDALVDALMKKGDDAVKFMIEVQGASPSSRTKLLNALASGTAAAGSANANAR